MDENLQKALALLDKAAQVISALLEERTALQSKGNEDLSKKAEHLAAKTGLSFRTASAIIKEAKDKGLDSDSLEKTAELLGFTSNTSFGKVANEEKDSGLTKTATEKFNEGIQEVLSDLSI